MKRKKKKTVAKQKETISIRKAALALAKEIFAQHRHEYTNKELAWRDAWTMACNRLTV